MKNHTKYAKLKAVKTRECLNINWKDYIRIVNLMYDVIGKQNGRSTEKCLEKIARYVSKKEGRQYSVSDIGYIYKYVTSGGVLKNEVKIAQRFSCRKIQNETRKILENSTREGFHQGERTRQQTETEKSAFYELEKRVKLARRLDID